MALTGGIEPVAFEQHMLEKEKPPTEVIDRTWGLKARTLTNISFEEYQYWARLEREEEIANNKRYVSERGPLSFAKIIKGRFSKGIHHENKKKAEAAREVALKEQNQGEHGEKGGVVSVVPPGPSAVVTEEEWKTAARALRTASWGTIFYLITTDILGWASTPFVFSSVGYGAGVALYIVFGLAAFASGWFLYTIFLGLDSARYPMLSYGDTYLRVFGNKSRHFINVTQAFQQFMTVAVLILGCATTIAQLSNTSICFVACMIITMVIGMALGTIRSLQRLGWLCNLSVWMNVISFVIILYACSHYLPDYSVVINSTLIKTIEAVKTFAGPPPSEYQQQAPGFAGQFNGVDQMIYSWGGALLFIAFIAEMRHPMDFWKAMLCAQIFIGIVYIFFGSYVYSHYGQYSASSINNVVQPVHLQTAGNVFYLITSFIACLLYFNIGMKTVYIEVFESAFNFPTITSKKGKWLWYALGPIYWIVAFLVAAAVPNLNGISGLVSSLLILNFTYTFPALVYIGYRCQLGAQLPGEGFDPATGVTTRHDTGIKRWIRGYTKVWYITIPNTIYFLGGLACSGMGTWAAVEGLIAVFGPGGTVATSFGCAAPV
ncbi:transmembrane amino acid transporter [Myriangium duriaei CBS 260.36]|uniref:Transmembrane amino acid transporter n=1 Tax=Myriangium duriaei CBS 260.36 TaxID=1168546 RepID=A0A9P4IZJ7_9PEZI|nr:transmembrane amino acid transporter [Myriangium duriaei CBS 260.36]